MIIWKWIYERLKEMISVCIPIYNYYAYPLVRRLVTQRDNLKNPGEVEIVCIDDHSSGYYLSQNNGIVDMAKYLRLGENVGRARIRNLFLKHTQGDWLLFLNDDAQVPDNFLQKYLRQTNGKADVIVGGMCLDKGSDDADHRLRFLAGAPDEGLTAAQRDADPYRHFLAGNFMIRRNVMETVRFDARYDKYGSDGDYFAYQLSNRKVSILHIDNEVTSAYVETNAECLHKSVEAVEELIKVYDDMWEDQRFCRTIPLLNLYARVRRMHLQGIVYWFFKMFRSPMESHFVTGRGVSMKQFKFYKLGVFIEKRHYSTKK